MKIEVMETKIECTAEELRQSNTLSDGIYNALRKVFNGSVYENDNEEDETDEKEQTE